MFFNALKTVREQRQQGTQNDTDLEIGVEHHHNLLNMIQEATDIPKILAVGMDLADRDFVNQAINPSTTSNRELWTQKLAQSAETLMDFV